MRIGIVDFADAFMSVPLAAGERRYNCAELTTAIDLGRSPLHSAEPRSGRMVVWRVLGFGGRPNPLVFGRITAALMRMAQTLLTTYDEYTASAGSRRTARMDVEPADCLEARARAHLYVDDAALALAGTEEEVHESFDVFLLFLLVMGAPISWGKVSLHPVLADPVRWIGVEFSLTSSGRGRMQLPADFLKELMDQVIEVARIGGRISDADANKLVGRAARVSFVVPASAPFSAALRAALTDARATASDRRRAHQRSSHAAARFATAASWFVALLGGCPLAEGVELPLQRVIEPGGRLELTPGACEALVFDASPWGGGIVHFSGKQPVACQILHWTPELCRAFGVRSGESKFLAFFESLTALIGLLTFCRPGRLQTVGLVGDNLGALSVALSRPGRGDLARVCREIALCQARWGLKIAVAHLPSELNDWADSLSRLHSPSPLPVPTELADLPREPQPDHDAIFSIALPVAGYELDSA